MNSIFDTNLVIEGNREIDSSDLIARLRDGICIGRLWYLYPVYGLAKADFTGTVIGDSYIIRGGKIASPLMTNTARITDNFSKLLRDVAGISDVKKPTQLWHTEGFIYATEIAVKNIKLENFAE